MFDEIHHADQFDIGGLIQTAFGIVNKAGIGDVVIGAGGIGDKESLPAGIGDRQAGKSVARAGRAGGEAPAVFSRRGGLGHKNAVVPTFPDGNVLEGVASGVAHEDAKFIAGEDGVLNGVMIEAEVNGNARGGVVVKIQPFEEAVLGQVAGKAIVLIVESGKVSDGELARAGGGDQAAGA